MDFAIVWGGDAECALILSVGYRFAFGGNFVSLHV